MPRQVGRHLLGSKWTALTPVERQKHFLVVTLLDEGATLELEAVTRGARRLVPAEELADPALWLRGWR